MCVFSVYHSNTCKIAASPNGEEERNVLRVYRARLQVSNDYPGRKMIQFSGNGAQSEINPLIMAGRWEESERPILGGDISYLLNMVKG